jgi:hypothetical protein
MAAHSLTHAEAGRSRMRRKIRNGSIQLGWAYYGLLISILAGILGLIGFVFVLSSN